LLIAMPGIGDPRFERSVLLIWAHDADHALGLAINRPVEGFTLGDLFERLDIRANQPPPSDPILLGGPLEAERGFVLHTDDYQGPHSVEAGDGLALTATREVLQAMAMHAGAPRKALLALGYAGWGEGQLESELRENVWLTCEADEDLIFGEDHDAKWTRALAKLGVDPQHLSYAAGRA
jgi:putative transcriptional regulator